MSANQSQKTANHLIYCSASFDSRSKKGIACKILLSHDDVNLNFNVNSKSNEVLSKEFDQTSAASLELETIMWALEGFSKKDDHTNLAVISDLKAGKTLLEKREKLEKSNYEGARPGFSVTNAELYKKLYKLHDKLGFEIQYFNSLEIKDPHDKKALSVIEIVKNHSQDLLSQNKKEEISDKIADKWF